MKRLLEADWLRRLAHPWRARHPRAYATLNRLRQRVVAGGEGLDAYQATALRRFLGVVDVRGARVLELGSDREVRVLRALRRHGARVAMGLNDAATMWGGAGWDGARSAALAAEGLEIVRGDAAALPFADGTVDHVFSVAVLEHLADLPAALREVHRVLRPGGIMYGAFGPLWSSGKGHHVLAEAGGVVVRHSDPTSNPLPDFAHLLLDEEQLRAGLAGRTAPALIEPIVEFVYRSTYVNRLFYRDYVAAFDACDLELVELVTQRDPVAPALQRILELRHPGETRFDVTNADVVLRKAAR